MKFQSRFTRLLNNLSINRKLMLSYILVVFIPVLTMGAFLTNSLREIAMETVLNEATDNVGRVAQRINDVLRGPVLISSKFYGSAELENIIYEEYDPVADAVKIYFNEDEFDEIIDLYKEVADINLYVTSKSSLDNSRYIKNDASVLHAPWFESSLKLNGRIRWDYIQGSEGEGNMDPGFYMVRLLKSVTEQELGVLAVQLDPVQLDSILKQESFETLLINDQGIIIAADDPALTGASIDSVNLSATELDRQGIRDVVYRGQKSKVITRAFSVPESSQVFQVISIFTVNEIMTDARAASRLGFSIIAISLTVSLMLIVLFSSILGRRIRKVGKDMHLVATGNFNFTSTMAGQDEAGQLANNMNQMVTGIRKLVHEVYESNLQKKDLLVKHNEIKLKMLANQISPHFLFNTLEAIRMNAHNKGEHEIARVVKLLGKIMHMNLSIGNEKILMEKELDLIKSYLEIQKFRYGDKIDYTIDQVSPDILACRILPLIIQPLVENAVVHGLEHKEGKGLITIHIDDADPDLEITVTDDGVGMDAERLALVVTSLDEQDGREGKRIGLSNIHQRLKLYYGQEYGIHIVSEQNKGTRLTIRLPKGGI